MTEQLERSRPATARPDLTGRTQMRRYHPWRLRIDLRQPNRGRVITDGLKTVEVDPRALDIVSELEPLTKYGVPFLDHFWAMMIRWEFPRWLARGQFWRYFSGIFGPNFRVDWTQGLANRFGVARQKQTNLAQLKEGIRRFAAERGFALFGVTRIDRRFVAEGEDELFPFDTAVVLGMEMDPGLLDQMPSPGERLVDFEVYVEAGRKVMEVARFIRSQGYRCVPRTAFDPRVKYVPHAVNAGLAELGANGLAITPQFGPRQRWCMISVEADLEPDQPADFGIRDFCDECLLCVRGCPGRALTERRIWFRGVHKHKLHTTRCWPYFLKFDGCSICLKVCPLNRHGYDACMEAFQRDDTILGKPPGIERFLERRARATGA